MKIPSHLGVINALVLPAARARASKGTKARRGLARELALHKSERAWSFCALLQLSGGRPAGWLQAN